MIAIIDYEIGNLGSVLKALKYLKVPVTLTMDYQEIKEAAGIILPGVGAFGEGMENLRSLKLEQLIKEEIAKGKPLLGICLGMQLLFTTSEEDRGITGLSLIAGQVKKFNPDKVGKVPHIGWNQVELVKDDSLFKKLGKEDFYFVHSYYVEPENKEVILGKTVYGSHEFVSVVKQNNIWGIQCHPEKSSRVGLQVLKNFSEVVYDGGYSGN